MPLDLRILHAFDVYPVESEGARSWSVRTAGYAYEIRHADARMIFAYHWHPASKSSVVTPHLHLGGTIGDIDLSRSHLPTGVVPLPEFLAFAIRDLGVQPLRSDWPEVLRVGAWGA